MSIANAINTLKGKGYSDAEIQAIQFSVPKGDNRRLNALTNAARNLPDRNAQKASSSSSSRPAPAAAPAPIPAPQLRDATPRRLSEEQDGSNLKIKKKSKRKRSSQRQGTGQLRINPSSVASVNTNAAPAATGGVNI